MSEAASTMAGSTSGPMAPTNSGGGLAMGRMFVNPRFDYLLIGGGLSLIVIPLIPTPVEVESTPSGMLGDVPEVVELRN